MQGHAGFFSVFERENGISLLAGQYDLPVSVYMGLTTALLIRSGGQPDALLLNR